MGVGQDLAVQALGFFPLATRVGEIRKAFDRAAVTGLDSKRELEPDAGYLRTQALMLDISELGNAPSD